MTYVRLDKDLNFWNTDALWEDLVQKIFFNGVVTSSNEKNTRLHYLPTPYHANLLVDNHPPLLQSRRVPRKLLLTELLMWVIGGSTKLEDFRKKSIRFYDGVLEEGQAIPYGNWKKPLEKIISELRNRHASKKLILDCPPAWETNWYCGCIRSIQFLPRFDQDVLNAHIVIRSSDVALGLPCDIYQMGALMRYVAEKSELTQQTLSITISNAHLYNDHLSGVSEQLQYTWKGETVQSPKWDWEQSVWNKGEKWDEDIPPYEDYGHGVEWIHYSFHK